MDFRDIHLRVLYSFNYETKGGRKISITQGEKLFLIRKTNADWWQVIRNSSERPFFVPASYVEEIRYGESRIGGNNSFASANRKKTDYLNAVSNNTPAFKEKDILDVTDLASYADCTNKKSDRKMSCNQEIVYSNLPPVNQRISSEKWRLWAAEELISELAQTATLHTVDNTTYTNVPCQRKTVEESYLKTQPDSCANSLSYTDKESGYDHKAQCLGAASSSDESLFLNKKGDTVVSCIGSKYSGECQDELLHTTNAASVLNEPANKCEKFRCNHTASKSICDLGTASGGTVLSIESGTSENSGRHVPLCKIKSKDIAVIPEIQKVNSSSDPEGSCSSEKHLVCGSSTNSVNWQYNTGDSAQDFQTIDVCSVRTDMFSKMKSKLKYSTSFKTKRELQRLSEKREGNSVLSSSWDKLDNLKSVEGTGHLTQDNSENVCSDVRKCSESQKTCSDDKNGSVVRGNHGNPAASHDNRYLDLSLMKKSTLECDNEYDCNANYTSVVKEKSSAEGLSECENAQDKGGLMPDTSDAAKDWSDSEHSEDLLCLSDGTLKSQKISSSCETIEDWEEEEGTFQPECAVDVVSIPLPEGWVESYDEQLDLPCYVHEKTAEKWFSSNDAEGRVYFYQENSSESSWRLPEVPTTMLEELPSGKLGPKEVTKEKEKEKEKEKPAIIISSDDSQIRHQHETENRPTFRMAKARSMVLTDTKSKEGSTKSSSIPRNYLHIWDGRVHTLMEGTLNKTKMWEIGGKKVRKNWAPSYVVLSKFHLLFFKDMKTYNALKLAALLGSSSGLPDMCIDLKGALVEEAEKLSSRRYVFAVTTVQGLKVLLQCDDKLLYTDWYHGVRNAIRSITEGSGLRNSSSTKDVGSFLNQAVSPNQSRKDLRIDRSRSVKNKNRDGSLEDLASSPEDQQIGIHTRLKYFFLRRPLKEALEQRGILKNEAVFGCHLPDVCHEEPHIPLFVLKCVEVIESKDENMKTVGLYRASGNLSQVQKIRLQVNQDNYKALEEEEDVHVLTGALKLFFRELKEPLIPCRMFNKALEASSKPVEEEKLRDFQEIVNALPKPNRCTLEFLLKHLLRVTEYKADNQMSIHTLAIVFGPSLMWPEQESQNIAFDYMMQNVVIEFLLKAFQSIFGDNCIRL